ncbi:MAG TPA: SseB family protein [Streptosporangiaceae bacterium]
MSIAADSNTGAHFAIPDLPAGTAGVPHAASTMAGETATGDTATGDTATGSTVTADTTTANALPASTFTGGQMASDTAQEADVEQAIAAATRNADRIGALLDMLRTARLWLPLPDDQTPVIKGGAVTLPTVRYLGSDFVPAYTSARLLERLEGSPEPAEAAVPPPHAVVRGGDLARLLPASVGIALNPGAEESVPIYPQGVAYLAADQAGALPSEISLGTLPPAAARLVGRLGPALGPFPFIGEASAAWLSVGTTGEGLVISVTLDDPLDPGARDAVVAAIEGAVPDAAVADDAEYPIDVTFPGEGERDYIDKWIAAFTSPFYRR